MNTIRHVLQSRILGGLAAVAMLSTLVQAATFEIGTLPGKLRYDVELFEVRPNIEVQLRLRNTDEMQHNLIICSPGDGVAMKVAQQAWLLGAQSVAKQYVPEAPEVLFHTKVVNPGEEDTITFTTPSALGDYPYVCTIPGHAFSMKGVMRVTANPEAPKLVQVEDNAKKSGQKQLHLHVNDKPLVKRAYVEGGPGRSILVGLPGGINYCFDAETCCVRFGWFGMFLDVGPDWGASPGARGGKPVKTLGERFKVGDVDLPVRIGGARLTPQVEFKGYEWDGENVPVMRFLVNGAPVRQTVRPAPEGIGLQYDFEFDLINAPVFIRFDDRDVTLSATTGEWKDGVLHVSNEQTSKFSVIVKPRKNAALN